MRTCFSILVGASRNKCNKQALFESLVQRSRETLDKNLVVYAILIDLF